METSSLIMDIIKSLNYWGKKIILSNFENFMWTLRWIYSWVPIHGSRIKMFMMLPWKWCMEPKYFFFFKKHQNMWSWYLRFGFLTPTQHIVVGVPLNRVPAKRSIKTSDKWRVLSVLLQNYDINSHLTRHYDIYNLGEEHYM